MRMHTQPVIQILAVLVAIGLPSPEGAVAAPLAVARSGATPAAFVPKGWRIESRHAGDLDGDGTPDLVLVLLTGVCVKEREPLNGPKVRTTTHAGKKPLVALEELGEPALDDLGEDIDAQ